MNTQAKFSFKKIHIIGVAGSGMSSLAELALAKGLDVSGSDIQANDTTASLAARGLKFFAEHDKNNLPPSLDAVIISSAIGAENPELVEAHKLKIPVIHRSDALQGLLDEYKIIAVSGTHGKTTTTAMIFHMLESLQLQPGLYLGGKLRSNGLSAKLPGGKWIVLEADESDGSFLNYNPFISIITNIDKDHMDFYQSKEELNLAFKNFLQTTDPEGGCIVYWDDDSIRQISESRYETRHSFGSILGADIRLVDYSIKNGKTFYKIVVDKQLISGILPTIGKHNLFNAMAAFGVALALELSIPKAALALSNFAGVDRRSTVIYNKNNLVIMDDYAHNPGKISSVLKSLKEAWPHHKIVAVFQPHRFSRMRTLYHDFLGCFTSADIVVVAPIYSANEKHDASLSAGDFAETLKIQYNKICYAPLSLMDVKNLLEVQFLKPDHLIVTLGAGNINTIAYDLAEHAD